MLRPQSDGARRRLERAELIHDKLEDLVIADRDLAPAKVLPIGKPRMRTDCDTTRFRRLQRSAHHHLVAGMRAARDVRRRHERKQFLFMRRAFAEVRIEIDAQAHDIISA
jgi:hypothetical protein